MTNPPKISIVIPSFNAQKYITETLDSIFDQDYNNFEVIVQDGGSNDGTLEILKGYKKKFPGKIQFESKKDNGQADAINKGIKKTTGEIITFINTDDLYMSDAFMNVAIAFKNNPDSFWFAGKGKVIDKKGSEVSKLVTFYKNILLNTNSYKFLLIVNYLMQPSVFFTKKSLNLIKSLASVEGIVMEYETWLNLGKIKMPIVINEYLSSFRMSGSNLSSTKTKILLAEDERILKKFTKNPLIIFLHKLNNIGRRFMLQSLD